MMRLCVYGAMASALLACGNGSHDGDDASGAATTVSGTRVQVCHGEHGDTVVAVTAAVMIEAWVPDDSPTGYRVAPGVDHGDGTFSIPDVPDGQPYWLKLDDGGSPQLYVADQLDVEIRTERAAHCGAATASALAPDVTFAIDGMTPFASDESIAVDVFAIEYTGTQFQQGVATGATTLTGSHSWAEAVPAPYGLRLPDAQVGDVADVFHTRTGHTTNSSGNSVTGTVVADWLEVPITVDARTGGTITGTFQPVQYSHLFGFPFDETFVTAGLTPWNVLSGWGVSLTAHPSWAGSPIHANLVDYHVTPADPGAPNPILEIGSYYDSFPATWRRALTVEREEERAFVIPDPTLPADPRLVVRQTSWSRVAYQNVVDVDVLLASPSNVALAGTDFDAGGKVALAAPAPLRLTWDPVDGATLYHVELRQLRDDRVVAAFDALAPSLAIPAAMLADGEFYYMTLEARQYTRGSHPVELVAGGTPYRSTMVTSGRFHVVSHCGDGVIQPGETCDDAGESARCNADCTVAACGDGIVNRTAGEACDVVTGNAACKANCTLPPH